MGIFKMYDISFSKIVQEYREKCLNSTSSCGMVNENNQRWVLLPISYPKSWDAYKGCEHSFWTTADFSFDAIKDVLSNDNYSDIYITYIKKVFARFCLGLFKDKTNSKTEIHDISCITCELLDISQQPEVRSYYGFEATMECQINELFSELCYHICLKDDNIFCKLLDSIESNEDLVILAKCWNYHNSNDVKEDQSFPPTFAERLICHSIYKYG